MLVLALALPVDRDIKSIQLELVVNHVLLASSLLMIPTAKLALSENTLPHPVLPLVIHVVVVNKLLITELIVSIVLLAHSLMKTDSAKLAHLMKSPPVKELALVILVLQVMKPTLLKFPVILANPVPSHPT